MNEPQKRRGRPPKTLIEQDGQEASRHAHAVEIAGSNPAPATNDPEPPQDPASGDKTPEYIEWFKRNHSEEDFQKKYGHRKFTL